MGHIVDRKAGLRREFGGHYRGTSEGSFANCQCTRLLRTRCRDIEFCRLVSYEATRDSSLIDNLKSATNYKQPVERR